MRMACSSLPLCSHWKQCLLHFTTVLNITHTVDREIFAGINFRFLMFASFNFRCSALQMKIKPRRKFNAYSILYIQFRKKSRVREFSA